MRGSIRVVPVLLGVLGLLAPANVGAVGGSPEPCPSDGTLVRPHVVVATLDTGSNLFHPTWRRPQPCHPSSFLPGYPADAGALDLTFASSYATSFNASRPEIEKLLDDRHPYWVPGTNIVGTWAATADTAPVIDGSTRASHSHGASASSQIAGIGYGTAPDAYLVIVDRTPDPGTADAIYRANAEALRWAADQPWIDIIHTNIQNPVPLAQPETPAYPGYAEAVTYAVGKGKLVVSAGGNFYAEPTETSPHAGPAGVLVAGANDNCGYTEFSNPDPHVVMDGARTIAAHPTSFGDASFGGTSSASPRISGYAAQVLLELRRRFGYSQGVVDGSLLVVPEDDRPASGPLADGALTAADLHQVIRRTADPNPHASKFDGDQSTGCIPQPQPLPFAFYPKMGYGEISEHTIERTIAVAAGDEPMPARPVEDGFFGGSEVVRTALW